MKKNQTVRGFNILAPIYDLLLILLARPVKKSSLELISEIPDGINILLLGEGSGNFLKKLMSIKKQCKVTCLDISPNMIKTAQRKNSLNKNIEYVCANALEYNSDEKYQVIVSNFFLDLFPVSTIEKIILRYSTMLTKRGYWYFTDFTPAPGLIYNSYLSLLYLFFRVICKIEGKRIPDIEKIFYQHRFSVKIKKKTKKNIDSVLFIKR